MLDIDPHAALRKIADMSVRREHLIIGTKEFLDRFYFCRRLYNHQIFWHSDYLHETSLFHSCIIIPFRLPHQALKFK